MKKGKNNLSDENIILVVLGLFIGMLFGSMFLITDAKDGGNIISGAAITNNELLYVMSDDCELCMELAPIARLIAKDIGAEFRETFTQESLETASYILVYDGETYVGSASTEEEIYYSICAVTKNSKVCSKLEQKIIETKGQKVSSKSISGSIVASIQ